MKGLQEAGALWIFESLESVSIWIFLNETISKYCQPLEQIFLMKKRFTYQTGKILQTR